MFSPSQYQEATSKLGEQPRILHLHASELEVKAQHLADEWYIPEPVAEVILELVSRINTTTEQLISMFEDALESIGAPWSMWENHHGWQSLRGSATGVAANVTPSTLGSVGSWTGAAATAYTQAIGPQSAAAARLGSIADKVQGLLASCAEGGALFYLGLLVEAVQLLFAYGVASAATATGVAAPGGLVVALGGSAAVLTAVVALVSALTNFAKGQADALSDLQNEAVDQSAFPFGHWPKAVNV
ncbi:MULTISPECIES: hypothetical protein [Streptacidiphilus]|uniref:WXG100 family type VII secretion target n=2 Tax=Streptacidiphilus TaxID=228398 RepID=A0ABV6ULN4_9ACTN|nr:hypothetical protein [Streptacidiphilus jeojiense]